MIQLEVVTPEGVVLQEQVTSLVLPGMDGLFGVLRNHQSLVAALKIGPVVYRQNGERLRLAIAGGFFEFTGNQAIILTDAAEPAEAIDVARAQRAAERARKRLADRKGDWDFVRAQAALERALNRLRLAGSA